MRARMAFRVLNRTLTEFHAVCFAMLHVVVAIAVALLWSSSAFAQAGGLTLPEQGGPISGTSQAGQAAIARDASTAWLNPAGLTRPDESQFLADLVQALDNYIQM